MPYGEVSFALQAPERLILRQLLPIHDHHSTGKHVNTQVRKERKLTGNMSKTILKSVSGFRKYREGEGEKQKLQTQKNSKLQSLRKILEIAPDVVEQVRAMDPGGVLWGKKDRDDLRKS